MNENNISSTSKYEVFKNLSYNRKNGINKSKLKELTESIKKNNYLHLHPIIIDEYFNVIDGQHRLEVAKSLQVPIFYLLEKNISYDHVMDANTAQSTWKTEDIINFYAIKYKNSHYIELNSLMRKFKLKPKGLFGLIFGICNRHILNIIKKGNFSFPENREKIDMVFQNYDIFIKFIEERRVRPFTMFSNILFTKAFRLLVINESFQMNIFLKKLENRWFDLKPQIDEKNWYSLLIDIYNWHNKGERIENG